MVMKPLMKLSFINFPQQLTFSPLKMDGWNTSFLLGRLGLFSGANLLLVLGSVTSHHN